MHAVRTFFVGLIVLSFAASAFGKTVTFRSRLDDGETFIVEVTKGNGKKTVVEFRHFSLSGKDGTDEILDASNVVGLHLTSEENGAESLEFKPEFAGELQSYLAGILATSQGISNELKARHHLKYVDSLCSDIRVDAVESLTMLKFEDFFNACKSHCLGSRLTVDDIAKKELIPANIRAFLLAAAFDSDKKKYDYISDYIERESQNSSWLLHSFLVAAVIVDQTQGEKLFFDYATTKVARRGMNGCVQRAGEFLAASQLIDTDKYIQAVVAAADPSRAALLTLYFELTLKGKSSDEKLSQLTGKINWNDNNERMSAYQIISRSLCYSETSYTPYTEDDFKQIPEIVAVWGQLKAFKDAMPPNVNRIQPPHGW